METHAYGLTRSRARQSRAQAHPKRGDYRQPVRENQGNRGARGYDSGKKVNGRKRHLLVDTTGLILSVLVHEANIQDYTGGKRLLCPLKQCFPRLRLIWADGAYKKGGFVEWVKATLGWEVEIVEHPWSGLRGVWARFRCGHRWGEDPAERMRMSFPTAGLSSAPSPGFLLGAAHGLRNEV